MIQEFLYFKGYFKRIEKECQRNYINVFIFFNKKKKNDDRILYADSESVIELYENLNDIFISDAEI